MLFFALLRRRPHPSPLDHVCRRRISPSSDLKLTNISSSATKFSDFKHIVGKLEFLWADYYTKIYSVFVSTVELRTLYIQELPYMNTFCECILKKIGLTHAHFQYNSRKLVNVVKVSFTMMYSSRKLNNKKVITTACNFWRQIACSFKFYGRTNHFCAKSTRKTLFEFPAFFHLTNIDVTSCIFRQFFRPLYDR